MTRVRQAAVLCGGLGSRLGELTAGRPKPLLPVGGRPFLEILVEEIVRQGVDRIVLLAAFESSQIRKLAEDLPSRLELDFEVDVCVEPDRAGTGGALWHARPYLDEAFFLLNGDSWFDAPLYDLLAAYESAKDIVGVLSLRILDDTDRFGVVEITDGVVTAFSPRPAVAGSGLVNAGVYLFQRSLIDYLKPQCSLEQDILPVLAQKSLLRGVATSSYFIDIGIPADYERSQTEIPLHRKRPAVFLDRDGVLNRDHGHVGSVDRHEWVDGARDAVRRINRAGYYAFVVTNQAGIGKGFYDEAGYRSVREHQRTALAAVGAFIDDERFCPYHPHATVEHYRRVSDWRKPAPGMLLDLLNRWPVDVKGSFLVGDNESDLAAARGAGIDGYLFSGGNLDAFIAPLLRAK